MAKSVLKQRLSTCKGHEGTKMFGSGKIDFNCNDYYDYYDYNDYLDYNDYYDYCDY